MKKLLISLILVSFTTASAECLKPVTALPEGTPAPCTGFLFTPQQEQIVRQLDLDVKYYKDINSRLEQSVTARQQDIDIMQKRIDSYQAHTDWERIGYFLAGAILTGAIAYGTVKALK